MCVEQLALQFVLMNKQLFPQLWEPQNRNLLIGISAICDVLQYFHRGIKQQEYNHFWLSGFLRFVYQKCVGVRKQKSKNKAIDTSESMNEALDGGPNSPTRWTAHGCEEGIKDVNHHGNIRLFSCAKFETKVRELKYAGANGIVTHAPEVRVMDHAMYRGLMLMLWEGCGLDAQYRLVPKQYAKFKIQKSTVMSCPRPMFARDWRSISIFVDMLFNPERACYVDGHRLSKVIQKLKPNESHDLHMFAESIRNSCQINIYSALCTSVKEYKRASMYRHGSRIHFEQDMIASEHTTASSIANNNLMLIEKILKIEFDGRVYDIAVGNVVKLLSKMDGSPNGILGAAFVRRVQRATATNKRIAMMMERINTRLLSWPQCVRDCKYMSDGSVEHCSECIRDKIFVSSWLGKGILPLFDALLKEHESDLRMQ